MCLTGTSSFLEHEFACFLAKSAQWTFVILYPAFLKSLEWKIFRLARLLYCPPLKLRSFLNLMLDSPLQDRCRRVSGAVTPSPVGKPEIPPSSPLSWAAEDQTSKAEKDVRPKLKNRHRAPFLSEKSTRQAPRGTNKTTNLSLKSNGKLRASSPVEDETAYDILRRCSQCDILLPLPTLNHHQVPSLCSLHIQLWAIRTVFKEMKVLRDVLRQHYLPFLCVSGSTLTYLLCIYVHHLPFLTAEPVSHLYLQFPA